MQVDYIVVGIGLAGISFCEQLKEHNKTFVVFDDGSQQSSVVAGGLYNPVVLKRFTSVWKSKEQLQMALQMYSKLEKELQTTLDYKIPVYRKFASLEEQNDWFSASDKPQLKDYLSQTIIKNSHPFINADYGFGEVLQTGRIDVKNLVESYKKQLLKTGRLFNSAFKYEDMEILKDAIQYNHLKTKHIVFSEGFGLVKNPFFNTLPMVPTKGELLVIEAPDLKIKFVLKSGVFLIPLHNHLYIVGATYNWKDKTNNVTETAKEELLTKLKKLIKCSVKIVNQVAGIRPTVKDRRPLVGQHQKYKNLYLLNGLGTRGVIIGPYVAYQLYEFIENNKELELDIDIKRFYSSS